MDLSPSRRPPLLPAPGARVPTPDCSRCWDGPARGQAWRPDPFPAL